MLKGLFSDAEVRSIRRDYDSVWNEAPGGHPFMGERTEARLPFCERRRSLSKLAEDDRIYGAVEQLLGHNIIWGGSSALRFVGDSDWHTDNYDGLLKSCNMIKVIMYLEPVEKDTGCLRIIPGSHHLSFNRDLSLIEDTDSGRMPFGVPGRETPGYPMETYPADLLMFDSRAYHGAFGGRSGRSMMQMLFFPDPTQESDVESLHQIYDRTQ